MRVKGPNEVLEWVEDYSADMAATSPNDTISTSSWSVTGGLVVDSNTKTNTTATVWLSGGTEYTYGRATNTIVTTAGRTFVRAIDFDIRNEVCA